jgi:hypothetical protein
MRRRLTVALLSCVVGLAGCSLVSSGNQAGYEVAETQLQQAHAEILATPTSFFISMQDDQLAWERARYFLENYAGGSPAENAVILKAVGTRWGLQNGPKAGQYSYEVWKDKIGAGYRYTVGCTLRSDERSRHEQTRLNAGNLSRFISQGKLELALLQAGR